MNTTIGIAVSLWFVMSPGGASETPSAPARAELQSVITDERGRELRVTFDGDNQVRLGVLSGLHIDSAGVDHAPDLEIGVALRTSGDTVQDETSWDVTHRFAWGRVRLDNDGPGGAPPMDVTAYQLHLIRHTREPFLLWPSSPPKRLFFPFDVGIGVDVGRVQVERAGRARGEELRIGAVRAALLLDPWRPDRPGTGFEFGPVARYDIDLIGEELADPEVIHRLAPLSALHARFRWRDAEGHTGIDVGVELGAEFSSKDDWNFAFEATGRMERVVIAVNDQPVFLIAEGGARYRPGRGSPGGDWELRVQGGMGFGFQLL